MFGRSDDLNPLVPPEEPGYGKCPDKRHREPTDQYHAPGGVPGTQDKESRNVTATQIRTRKEEKIKVLKRHRGLSTEPCLSVARCATFHQTTQLSKLFGFHRQQARYLKPFYLPSFFFREYPRPSKGKTRRGGQCRRGTQKPDGNTLAEPLVTSCAPSTGPTPYGISLCTLVRQPLVIEVTALPPLASPPRSSPLTEHQVGSI
ncbi:uncharacterized protein [Ranitomeya imitator]|uniref:uncharacterized protein isoform X2 n=1 Tax=Ranitomeya imitator TaxID=111125 RepID=UPI0037E9B353